MTLDIGNEATPFLAKIDDLSAQDIKKGNLSMNISFDEVEKRFFMVFLQNENAFFQIKMDPPDFEKLTSDMLKMVKQYNLQQALEYLEKRNAE